MARRSKLAATIISPYIVPPSAWGRLGSFEVVLVLVSIRIVRVVRARESVRTWLVDLPRFCFNS